MQEIDRLVKMANQIAANFVLHDDAAERVADHLQRFWAPSMRQKILEYDAAGGEGLDPLARAAVRTLGSGT
jgi:formate dehydrogenase subunit delta